MKEDFKIEFIESITSYTNDNVDVGIKLSSGEEYMVSFFTLKNVEELMLRYENDGKIYDGNGECNNGGYFWSSDMCIIKSLDINTIKETIKHIIEEGNLERIFTKIEKEP